MPTTANNSLIDRIDQCLPQTQCTLCSFPRCREYAIAIAGGNADINQCPPGGDVTIAALSALLGRAAKPLNEEFGRHQPKVVALIHEAQCIGCKLCIKACPVDCIVGGPKLMHTVIEDECTGCRLCLPVCPTDCIEMIEPAPITGRTASPWTDYASDQVDKARINTENRLARIRRREDERKNQMRQNERAQMKKEIAEALQRKAQEQTRESH